jgi:hypothetical protein
MLLPAPERVQTSQNSRVPYLVVGNQQNYSPTRSLDSAHQKETQHVVSPPQSSRLPELKNFTSPRDVFS